MAALPPALHQQPTQAQLLLTQAADLGRHDMLAALLRLAGSDADGVGQACRVTAFLTAAAGGHAQCLRVLLEASTSPAELVQARSPTAGATALMISSLEGFEPCVEVLLQHSPGVQLAATTPGGLSALMLASSAGHVRCAEALLRHDPAQVAVRTPSGSTAASVAAFCGQPACLQLLLQQSPQAQGLDKALVDATIGWEECRQARQQGGVAADGEPFPAFQDCAELLLSKGAMLVEGAPDGAFALVRPVIQDLAARALVPDMAGAAATKATENLRRCEAAASPEGLAIGAGLDAAAMRGHGTQGRKRRRGNGSDDSTRRA